MHAYVYQVNFFVPFQSLQCITTMFTHGQPEFRYNMAKVYLANKLFRCVSFSQKM